MECLHNLQYLKHCQQSFLVTLIPGLTVFHILCFIVSYYTPYVMRDPIVVMFLGRPAIKKVIWSSTHTAPSLHLGK